MKKHLLSTLVRTAMPIVLGGTLVAATAVQARTITHATGYPPNSIGANSANVFAQSLEEISGGELKARVFAGSLLSFLETSPGVRDGMADSGFILMSYYPNEFPVSNLAGELSMMVEEMDVPATHAGLAFTGALAEFVFNDCPECVEEFAGQNQVFTGASASTAYVMLCNKEVTSLDQARGKRIRTAGPHWARWTEAVGATPVTMSIADTYEALNQGVLDCTLSSPTELDIFKLREVTSHVTVNVPGGVYGATAVNNINRDTWRSLSDQGRRDLLKASAVLGADISWEYALSAVREIENAGEHGITIHQPADDMAKLTAEFIPTDIDSIAANYERRFGVVGAELVVDSFRSLLEKWAELVKDVDSMEELADLYWEELYSKVDVSTYGL